MFNGKIADDIVVCSMKKARGVVVWSMIKADDMVVCSMKKKKADGTECQTVAMTYLFTGRLATSEA